MTAERSTDLYPILYAASVEAHARARYEVAYHALVAAMHDATDARDAGRLADVEAEARRQIAVIDAQAPGHRMSTGSASRRGHPGMYAMLAGEAAAHGHMIGR